MLSLHLYTYCYNDPVYYIDVTGNKPIKPQPQPLPTPKPTIKSPSGPRPQPGPGPDYKIHIKYSKKQRNRIREYCEQYAKDDETYNPAYRRIENHDCANFVSQCLAYAGFHETSKWHYTKMLLPMRRFDTFSKAWSVAREQYKYFSQEKFCKKKIIINNKREIAKKTKNVKTGDLLYWAYKDQEGRITHSTIIYSNKKEKGKKKKVLRFGGHTNASVKKTVKSKFGDNYIKIVVLRLRDSIDISWLY